MNSPQCPKCKSTATSAADLARPGPNIFYTVLIGWLYLLPRIAFIPRAWICSDCGAYFRQRTPGSYVALILLILLVLSVALSAIFQVVANH
jgi:hypothetical protein